MEARAETVSVRLARSCERHLIENLSQFYINDFPETEPPGSDKMEFGDQGRYSGFSDLNSYCRVPSAADPCGGMVGWLRLDQHAIPPQEQH